MNHINFQIIVILQGCRNNDRKSQKKLYQLLKGYAINICYRYQDSAGVEELVQKGFIKLFARIQQFDENRFWDISTNLKGWFKSILINTCIDSYRARHPFSFALTKETEEIVDNTENGLDVLSYKEIILAIRGLSPGYRAVFNLFVIEGMSHQQISELLRISIGTSKSNLFKARKILRGKLVHKSEWYAIMIEERSLTAV